MKIITLLTITNILDFTLMKFTMLFIKCFPGGSDGKESVCNGGDSGSIPGLGDFLEKEMATHPSILAWRSPWAEKPGGLQSMGSQRAGQD